MSIASKIGSYGHGLIIWALGIPIFLFIVFPLAASTSLSTSHIHLISILWNSENKSWLRVGYYGLCLTRSSGSTSICTTTTGTSANAIAEHWGTTDAPSLSGIEFALKLQKDVFVAFLTAGGLAWLISFILCTMTMLHRTAPSRARNVTKVAAKGTAVAAALLIFASAWATNSATAALEVVVGSEQLKRGMLLIGLQWIAAILVSVHAWAVVRVADREEGGKGRGDGYLIARQWGS